MESDLIEFRIKKEMYNILKEKIRDRKLSYKKLSEKMRISESGFNKKINGKYFFTQEEIFLLKRIKRFLRLIMLFIPTMSLRA